MIYSIFIALLLTLLIETPLYFIFLYKYKIKGLVIPILMNIITNLTFNLLYIYVFSYSFLYLIIGEIEVFILEGLFLLIVFNKDYKCFIYSLVSNTLSLGFGLIFNKFIFVESLKIMFILVFLIIFIIEIIVILILIKKKSF